MDVQQRDLEHFLDAYAGHSILYKLLAQHIAKTRSPVYLPRNLAYIKSSSSQRRRDGSGGGSSRSRMLSVSNELLKRRLGAQGTSEDVDRKSDSRNKHQTRDKERGATSSRELKFQTTQAHKVLVRFKYGPDNVLCQIQEVSHARCPWCAQPCRTEYGLLKHLALVHDRYRYHFATSYAGDIYIDVYPRTKWHRAWRDRSSSTVSAAAPLQYSSTAHTMSTQDGPTAEEGLEAAVNSTAFNNSNNSSSSGGSSAVFQPPAGHAARSLSLLPLSGGREARSTFPVVPSFKPFYFYGRNTKFSFSFAEFAASAGETSLRKARLNVQQRVYYSSPFCVPKTQDANSDSDSDDNVDETWLSRSSDMLLDEFNDVNLGEKALMKLWNKLVGEAIMPHDPPKGFRVVMADRRVRVLLHTFVRRHATTIRMGWMENNLRVHMALLVKFGLISPRDVHSALAALDDACGHRLPGSAGDGKEQWGNASQQQQQLSREEVMEVAGGDDDDDDDGGGGGDGENEAKKQEESTAEEEQVGKRKEGKETKEHAGRVDRDRQAQQQRQRSSRGLRRPTVAAHGGQRGTKQSTRRTCAGRNTGNSSGDAGQGKHGDGGEATAPGQARGAIARASQPPPPPPPPPCKWKKVAKKKKQNTSHGKDAKRRAHPPKAPNKKR